MVNSLVPGPCNKNPRIPETDFRDPETEIGSLETEMKVDGINGTLETGFQRILACWPHKGGWRTIPTKRGPPSTKAGYGTTPDGAGVGVGLFLGNVIMFNRKIIIDRKQLLISRK